jgi:uncharacterized protein (TIGR00369 family)
VRREHMPSPCGQTMLLPPVDEYRDGYIRSTLDIDPRFLNGNGVVHGGYIASLIDDASSHAAMTVIPDESGCVTAELSISYFRPCFPDDARVIIEGIVINRSRRSYHVEVTIRRASDDKLIARGHAVQALVDRRS